MKHTKIISRLSAILMGSILCIPYFTSCSHGCKNVNTEWIPPTCTYDGYYRYTCVDCGNSWTVPSAQGKTDHIFDTTKCNTEQKCQNCSATKYMNHNITYENPTCTNCKKTPFALWDIPSVPITVNEKTSSGRITDTYVITKIEPDVTDNADEIGYSYYLKLTVKRTYPYNLSSNAKIGWKLYNSDNMVVRSGTSSSGVSIACDEFAYVGIELNSFNNVAFEEGYKLVFLDIQ